MSNAVPSKRFAEFFAGIGLVREGLEASGWRCDYANDIDPKKHQAYRARFGTDDHFHLGDVWDTAAVVARIRERPFLATASFPCVDLSVAGHYRGLAGEHSSTFFGFASALEALGGRRPRVVLLENVPGFLTSRKGADFAAVVRSLADLGYWIDTFVLDARHFTPQSRPRVFVVGVTQDHLPLETDAPSLLRPAGIVRLKRAIELRTGWFTLPLPDPPVLSVKLDDVIDTDGQEWWADADTDRHCRMMNDRHRERVQEIRSSGRRWVGTIFRRIRDKQMRAEVRFDGLAGCLRTPRGGSAKQIVIATERSQIRMRWMTPREYARLQGTPDYPLVGTTIQQLWGFADAVCVPAVRWIDRHVLTPLFESGGQTRTRSRKAVG